MTVVWDRIWERVRSLEDDLAADRIEVPTSDRVLEKVETRIHGRVQEEGER